MRRVSTVFATALTILVTSAAIAHAQGPSVTVPAPGQIFPAGPDYATDVLQDPWDFANEDDISQNPDEYLSWMQSAQAHNLGRSTFLQSGRFVAQSNSIDPMLGLLYPGQELVVPTGRDGARFPIDTQRYRKLAVKLSVANGGSALAAYWFFEPRGAQWAANLGVALGDAPTSTDEVITVDLGSQTDGGVPYLSRPLARGLRLDPTATSGASVSVDWVRLTVADGGPGAAMMPVQSPNCSGGHTVSVIDAAGTSSVVKSGSGAIATSFNYGIFPPGAYTLRVACGNGTTDRAFAINDPARVTITAPSVTSGADYATTVIGNPWDMDDLADVAGSANVVPYGSPTGIVPSPAGGSMLRAVNVSAPGNPGVQGDPSIFLLNIPNNATPIATTKYRYLTFTMQIEYPHELGNNSVMRLFYGSRPNFDGNSVTTTKDILTLPGRATYTIDMASLATGPTLEPGPLSESWALRSVRYLRFDPHEIAEVQAPFSLDNVKLTAPDEVTLGGPYTVRWTLADADAGGTRTVRILLDTDTNVANGTTLIAQGIPAGSGAYTWQAQGVAPGLYRVYVEVTDVNGGASNTGGAYSTGLLRVLAPGAGDVVFSLASPQSSSTAYAGFSLAGCVYNPLAPSATGIDEVIAYAVGGPTGNAVQLLGTIPTGEWGTPLATGLGCPGTGGQFASSGFAVGNIWGLLPGVWNFRVLARNTLTGDFEEAVAANVTMDWNAPPPRNLRLTGVSGNTVAIAWDPPGFGRPVTGYLIQLATNPSFTSPIHVRVPAHVTSGSGALSNATWYVRVGTESEYATSAPSNTLAFTLPGGGSPAPVAAPGAPTLQIVQAQANPITLAWTAGQGGPPSQYVLYAGTTPGASNIGVFNVSGSSSITAAVPPGMPFYVRLVASNVSGAATSNEVFFAVGGGPPAAPSMNPASVSGNNVTLSWNAAAGATSYVVVARFPGSPAIIATLPAQTTNTFVPNVPPGTYVVTVVGVNTAGASAESNPTQVVVP